MMNSLQHEQYEYARKRINQKRRLYFHSVVFLLGSVFFILLNKAFGVGEEFMSNWFVWAIIAWLFILSIDFINFYLINRFMGKEWQRQQTEKLIMKQEVKIANMEKEIERKARLDAERKNADQKQISISEETTTEINIEDSENQDRKDENL